MRISEVSPTFFLDQSDMEIYLLRLNFGHTTFTPPINCSINFTTDLVESDGAFASLDYQFGWLQGLKNLLKGRNFLVAGGGFEPPTFGL
jgi:hypothetical protein